MSHMNLRAARRALLLAPLAITIGVASAGAQARPALDRSRRPAAAPERAPRLPTIQMRKLSNGIDVAVLEDHEIPAVTVLALVDAPPVLEPEGKSGLASLVSAMLGEGTTNRTAEQLSDAAADIGTSVSPFGFYTINANVDRAIELMADQLMNPAFPEASLQRLKANRITGIRRLRDNPDFIASRIMANALYGRGHVYERAATEASIGGITRDDLVAFHRTYYDPRNVKLVVAGDITPAQAVAKLERVFGSWPAAGRKAEYDIPAPHEASRTTIFLYDRPNSPQSVVLAGQTGPRRDVPEFYATSVLNTVLGGSFSSRINLNLRERHSYTYGARSSFDWRRRPQIGEFTAGGAVVTAKTDSALIELMRELRDVRGSRPLTAEELAFGKSSATRRLPLQFETVQQVAGLAANVLANDLPLDYYDTFSRNIAAVTTDQTAAAAQKYLDPDRMAIVVVGDRKVIEPMLRATNLAPIVLVDENGQPLPGT